MHAPIHSQLSLSTNMIERMGGLKLPKLKILSLGRNKIKKIECADLANTLQEVSRIRGSQISICVYAFKHNCFVAQLWMSYNEVSSLDGVVPLVKLKKL